MALLNPQPTVINGISYPFLDVSLAMSTRENGEGMTLSVVVSLTPYRQLEYGVEKLLDAQKVFVWGDAFEQAVADPGLAEFLNAIQEAGQTFINKAF